MSEAQAANAHGGRQASLGELRSSPVPGEAELGVPESEVAAAEDWEAILWKDAALSKHYEAPTFVPSARARLVARDPRALEVVVILENA